MDKIAPFNLYISRFIIISNLCLHRNLNLSLYILNSNSSFQFQKRKRRFLSYQSKHIGKSDMKRTGELNEGIIRGIRLSRSISGGKRVSLFRDEVSTTTTTTNTLKRQCSEKFVFNPANSMSLLEALPQDLLIRVLCRVDHDDLKQLLLVSKPVGEASLLAKKWHFEYSTPKKIAAFRNSMDGGDNNINNNDDDDSSSGEIQAPNAPRQARRRIRLCQSGRRMKLGDISVALFASSSSEEDAWWPRKH